MPNEHLFINFDVVKITSENCKVDKIYGATLKLVLQAGVAGITMRQIAAEAGMATGTLYIYFKDKDTLLNALFNKCRDSAVSQYSKGYSSGEPFEKGFKKIWQNMLDHRIANFEEAIFLEQCFHCPFITETTKEMSQRVLHPLLSLIERGKKEGVLKNEDTLLLLIYMLGSVSELIKYLRYTGNAVDAGVAEAAFKICWDGIAK